MDETVRKDALSTIDRVIEILRVKEWNDIPELKDLSNQTIHNASVFQDECSVSIAIVVYALYKIIERHQDGLSHEKFLKILEKARRSVINNEDHNFRISVSELFS